MASVKLRGIAWGHRRATNPLAAQLRGHLGEDALLERLQRLHAGT